MFGLGPARVPGDAAGLPQRAEPRTPPGEQLVHVRLVADVEYDPVDRRAERPVQRDGQLDHAEVRAQVAAGPRYRLDQDIPDFSRQKGQLVRMERLDVSRT